MKGAPAKGRKNLNQMLKQVQHDMQVWFSSLLSSRTCFGISVLGLEFGFKAPPCGRGSLLWKEGYIGKVWQRSFYDHALGCEEDLIKVAEYIVYNPVRKGLVKDWREYRYSWHKWM